MMQDVYVSASVDIDQEFLSDHLNNATKKYKYRKLAFKANGDYT